MPRWLPRWLRRPRPKAGPPSPVNCRHEPGPIQGKDVIEEEGREIGYHVRCRKCGIILDTIMEPREE